MGWCAWGVNLEVARMGWPHGVGYVRGSCSCPHRCMQGPMEVTCNHAEIPVDTRYRVFYLS